MPPNSQSSPDSTVIMTRPKTAEKTSEEIIEEIGKAVKTEGFLEWLEKADRRIYDILKEKYLDNKKNPKSAYDVYTRKEMDSWNDDPYYNPAKEPKEIFRSHLESIKKKLGEFDPVKYPYTPSKGYEPKIKND